MKTFDPNLYNKIDLEFDNDLDYIERWLKASKSLMIVKDRKIKIKKMGKTARQPFKTEINYINFNHKALYTDESIYLYFKNLIK